ncbi:hypothetical protein P7K49_011847 [Saguinus oedipus]|uniref:Uncharacterized protein n=1 Tax=Saguinus oedipus TaxID=9490 RepID=A0ABQ9VRU0_SAGOE|nr:hypothetical protein P7K49_011847 [Saguinus oedipus]
MQTHQQMSSYCFCFSAGHCLGSVEGVRVDLTTPAWPRSLKEKVAAKAASISSCTPAQGDLECGRSLTGLASAQLCSLHCSLSRPRPTTLLSNLTRQRTCAFLGMECDNNNDFDISSVKALDNKLCSEVCLPDSLQLQNSHIMGPVLYSLSDVAGGIGATRPLRLPLSINLCKAQSQHALAPHKLAQGRSDSCLSVDHGASLLPVWPGLELLGPRGCTTPAFPPWPGFHLFICVSRHVAKCKFVCLRELLRVVLANSAGLWEESKDWEEESSPGVLRVTCGGSCLEIMVGSQFGPNMKSDAYDGSRKRALGTALAEIPLAVMAPHCSHSQLSPCQDSCTCAWTLLECPDKMAAPALEGPSAPRLAFHSWACRGNEAEERAAAGLCRGPLRVLASGKAPRSCC